MARRRNAYRPQSITTRIPDLVLGDIQFMHGGSTQSRHQVVEFPRQRILNGPQAADLYRPHMVNFLIGGVAKHTSYAWIVIHCHNRALSAEIVAICVVAKPKTYDAAFLDMLIMISDRSKPAFGRCAERGYRLCMSSNSALTLRASGRRM